TATLIFYSSRGADGQLWCSYCRAIEGKVEEAFKAPDAPALTIVYVGLEDEYKKKDNVFGLAPWNVLGIPTLVHVDKGTVAHRYEEDPDIIKKLDEIIGART
ncbi:hypothetical protein C8J57DRAFT_1376561, partial [Mycena rebaudengoi]